MADKTRRPLPVGAKLRQEANCSQARASAKDKAPAFDLGSARERVYSQRPWLRPAFQPGEQDRDTPSIQEWQVIRAVRQLRAAQDNDSALPGRSIGDRPGQNEEWKTTFRSSVGVAPATAEVATGRGTSADRREQPTPRPLPRPDQLRSPNCCGDSDSNAKCSSPQPVTGQGQR